MDNRFRIDEDSRLLREMRKLSQTELADQLGLGIATINRWENMHKEPKEENFEKFYAYAYHSGIRFNRIKEQFYREELENGTILLFHGAKKSPGTIMILGKGSIWERPSVRPRCSSPILNLPVFTV